MIVVDASVWVAYVLPQDRWHQPSTRFLDEAIDQGIEMIVPTLFLAEVSASVARQTTPEAGLFTRAQLLDIDLFRWVAIDEALADAAAQFGAELQIRGADSIYATIAAQLDLALVSWDRNHLERASQRITVYTPETTPRRTDMLWSMIWHLYLSEVMMIIKFAPDFVTTIARAGLSQRALAKQAGISYSGLQALLNPGQQPERTIGGMRPVTAWKIAKAYADHTGIQEEDAYARLFVEEVRPKIMEAPSLARATTLF